MKQSLRNILVKNNAPPKPRIYRHRPAQTEPDPFAGTAAKVTQRKSFIVSEKPDIFKVLPVFLSAMAGRARTMTIFL
jgi:hypothetical protein